MTFRPVVQDEAGADRWELTVQVIEIYNDTVFDLGTGRECQLFDCGDLHIKEKQTRRHVHEHVIADEEDIATLTALIVKKRRQGENTCAS